MNVDHPILNAIGLCSGVGMLDEGVAAGLGYLGIDVRHVLYAEREAYPVSVLDARMEEGSLHPAPVWFGDFTKLPAAEFRGVVDIIIAGFPCQDLSVAGRRDGLDGKRSGLFFNILDIADDCGAWCLALENVAGIASATASVVDEAEGELDERAAARVVGELADRGWNAEWLTLSASDVGASHGRARWFAFAWRTDRMGNAGLQHGDLQQRGSRAEHPGAGQPLEHPGRMQRRAGHEQDRSAGAEAGGHEAHDWTPDGSCNVAHPERAKRRPQCLGGAGEIQGDDGGRRETHGRTGEPDAVLADPDHRNRPGHAVGTRAQEPVTFGDIGDIGDMANTDGAGQRASWGSRNDRERGARPFAEQSHDGVADASVTRLPQPQRADLPGAQWNDEGRAVAELRRPFFAPGPADPRWPGILQQWPHVAPALVADFRVLVDGLAFGMDDCRAQRLKCVGNGVVPLQAAVAYVALATRSGIFK